MSAEQSIAASGAESDGARLEAAIALCEAEIATLLKSPRNASPAHRSQLLSQLEVAVREARAAVSALRMPVTPAKADVTLAKALTALGEQRSDLALLDEAIVLGRAATTRQESDVSWVDVAAAYEALGNAALARGRFSPTEMAYLDEAVSAHRAALALTYDATRSFSQLQCAALGKSLLLAPGGRDRFEEHTRRVEANGSAAERLGWAIDAVALVNVLSDEKYWSTALDLLAEVKTFADRAAETPLWEAWARGIQDVNYWVKDPARKQGLHQELRDCVEAHGTPDMRVTWARVVMSVDRDGRAFERWREVLDDVRVLADRHPDARLRSVWASGAYAYIHRTLPKDAGAASQMLDQLEAYAGETGDPVVWSQWAKAACTRLERRDYSEANLDLARTQLALARPRLGAQIHAFWPKAAKTIHDILLGKDHGAAGLLRAEMKAVAESTTEETAWREWLQASLSAIRELRWTDYAAARALFLEMQAAAGGARDYDRKQALAKARGLLQDREVKLAHGMIQEVLQPLTLGAEATGTGDGLRVSRLDASKAPNLVTVGRSIHCLDMTLTGTAIEELPHDLQVTQRLDVSECRRLRRLPTGLKVGRLFARECTALETLPAGLQVSYLDLTGCSALEAIPADLVIRHGRLSLRGCERLTALPDSIGPIAQLDISGCLNITAIPPGLVVTAWIDIGGSGVRALPSHLLGIAIRWRGVPVDERIAFRPETLDVAEILAETNAERRRVMMERFGLDRFVARANAMVLDEDRDTGGPRRLLRIALAGDEPLVCVSVICPSTRRQFMLRVPPTMTSCRQAVAWTAGFDDPDEYQPGVET